MVVLCDTSAILMLLRIAPDMFTDPRYGCVTIRQIYDEITRTPKFKSKYLWLHEKKAIFALFLLPLENLKALN